MVQLLPRRDGLVQRLQSSTPVGRVQPRSQDSWRERPIGAGSRNRCTSTPIPACLARHASRPERKPIDRRRCTGLPHRLGYSGRSDDGLSCRPRKCRGTAKVLMPGVILVLLGDPAAEARLLAAAGRLAEVTGGAAITALIVRSPPLASIIASEEVLTKRREALLRAEEQARADSLSEIFRNWA